MSIRENLPVEPKSRPKAVVAGAGPVGCLAALCLSKQGYDVQVFEARSDWRSDPNARGRSINLALSDRGLLALEKVGLASSLRSVGILMEGRMLHSVDGTLKYVPYGEKGQGIMSVSRRLLNETILNEVEKQQNVRIAFGHKGIGFDCRRGVAQFGASNPERTVSLEGCDLIVGADGAFSAVRKAIMRDTRMNYNQSYITHGYKELVIPAGADGSFLMEKHALHIWPRGNFMMIALPNPGGDFTCTLFAPFELFESLEGKRDEEMKDKTVVREFFNRVFPDASQLMPTLEHDFFENPTSNLATIRCEPYHHGCGVLVGDAAHAVVPFFGQGCNAGLEDVRVLDELLRSSLQLSDALEKYTSLRKPDGDSIADLALENYYEMRDKTANYWFQQRLKVEKFLHRMFPSYWIPKYTMVTFSPNLRYSEARDLAQEHDRAVSRLICGAKWLTVSSAFVLGGYAAVKLGYLRIDTKALQSAVQIGKSL
eukprot:ANDGO_06185.mRNA.1 Kynurenine 3-monooxygenase